MTDVEDEEGKVARIMNPPVRPYNPEMAVIEEFLDQLSGFPRRRICPVLKKAISSILCSLQAMRGTPLSSSAALNGLIRW